MAGLRNAILTVEEFGAPGLSDEGNVKTFLPFLSYPTPYTGEHLSKYTANQTCLGQAVVNGTPTGAGRDID